MLVTSLPLFSSLDFSSEIIIVLPMSEVLPVPFGLSLPLLKQTLERILPLDYLQISPSKNSLISLPLLIHLIVRECFIHFSAYNLYEDIKVSDTMIFLWILYSDLCPLGLWTMLSLWDYITQIQMKVLTNLYCCISFVNLHCSDKVSQHQVIIS